MLFRSLKGSTDIEFMKRAAESVMVPEFVPRQGVKIVSDPKEEEKLKARALRAVVQDDFVTLGEVLNLAPVEKWSKWENKAGKDLLTLSQERGSSSAYSALARALGLNLSRLSTKLRASASW